MTHFSVPIVAPYAWLGFWPPFGLRTWIEHAFAQRATPVSALLILDVLLIAGLIANLGLFLSAKRDIRNLARRQKEALDALAARLMAAQFEAPQPLESLPSPATSAPPLRSGFNLSRRMQALRLLRRGQDVAHVAAVLGVTRREIELLIRVQQSSAARTPQKSKAAGA